VKVPLWEAFTPCSISSRLSSQFRVFLCRGQSMSTCCGKTLGIRRAGRLARNQSNLTTVSFTLSFSFQQHSHRNNSADSNGKCWKSLVWNESHSEVRFSVRQGNIDPE
jgi:hypothetical protein